MFECSLSEQFGFKVLNMNGRIDGMSAPEIEKQFSALILGGERTIVANLQEVTYISSAGLRVFLSAQKRLAKAGGEVVLYQVPPMVMDVLEMSNFTSLFRLFTPKDLIDPSIQGVSGTHAVVTRAFGAVNAEIIEQQAAPGHLEIIGSQEKFTNSEYSEEDVVTVKARNIQFGAGLAAYGEEYGDYRDFFGESISHPGIKLPIDGNDRGKPAGSDTGHHFETEYPVARGFAGRDAHLAHQGVKHLDRTFHMAGCAAAHLDIERSLGLEPELVVKCRHAVNLAGGELEIFADADDRLARQEPAGILHFLQDGDEVLAPCVGVLRQDLFDTRVDHGSVPLFECLPSDYCIRSFYLKIV